ncbi:hypothetical protein ACQR1V_03015 [Bradyrhizobium oligotrophicum]|uniref:hypothetical protein n=1 Tax=Bradyrhizobium oligotrophicum TaxID=44255 RepID=UPI003EBD92E9
MLDILTQIVAVCFVSYAIAVLMPSWPALLAATESFIAAASCDGLHCVSRERQTPRRFRRILSASKNERLMSWTGSNA